MACELHLSVLALFPILDEASRFENVTFKKAKTWTKRAVALPAVVMGFLSTTAPQASLCPASGAGTNLSPHQVSATHEANRLRSENSPYLLEHADDLVNWYPWGAAAFERAQRGNKLIFLSVGYSSCHWCHVMQKEDFQDPAVADLMNRAFVAILVDREERPDIDRQYMAACEMLTGAGGWPLNIIMTPARVPFFASVFIPKNSAAGRLGMIDLISKIQQKWETDPKGILKSAGKVGSQLVLGLSRDAPGKTLQQSSLKKAYEQLCDTFDSRDAGFGGSPKFPPYLNIDFLLRYWKRTADPKALDMVERTLDALSAGAISDQVGFGVHRYTLDAEWRIPHFEKMLYDQAQAAEAYIEAYQATGRQRYANAARHIFEYVSRDLTSPQGAFYDAEDADSEGMEGRFYLWTEQQIREALNNADAALVMRAFGVTSKGNFPSGGKGENTLYLKAPLIQLAAEWKIPEATLRGQLESACRALFVSRDRRVHPSRDEKVMAAWNGLMIAAFAKGAQASVDKRYEEVAQGAADFVLKRMTKSEEGHPVQLLHSFFGTEASGPANLDDYAYMILGLLDLYETNFKVRNLQAAIDLNQELIQNFWDQNHDGFFYTPNVGQDGLLTREKNYEDSDLPSGNAVAALDLMRLGSMTGSPALEQRAVQLVQAISGAVESSPAEYPALLLAAD
ncbi:MAG TPA: thioredoxin domain-containing protein, partial [Terriglobia bacterium]|nr:thioredoxin domain-containing protein [Terriglobia bacterium]